MIDEIATAARRPALKANDLRDQTRVIDKLDQPLVSNGRKPTYKSDFASLHGS